MHIIKLMRLQVSTGLQGHLSLLYSLQVKMISTFQNPYGTGMSMVDKLQLQILDHSNSPASTVTTSVEALLC